MTCPRCQGCMVSDLFLDLAETQGMWMRAARCMNCGHVIDAVMERNRQQAIKKSIQTENDVVLPTSEPVFDRSPSDTNML
jgi:uncharacterized Zn finger protein